MKEHFDLVLLLTLPDRRRDAVARIHEAGFDRLMVIEAFRGDILNPPSWWRAGNGAWGCYASHVYASQSIWLSGAESGLILEDDVVFGPSFGEKLDILMEHTPPDWGQIYLGGQFRGRNETINKYVLRPSRVNRTHSYALSRNALPTILKHLTEYQQIIKGDAIQHIDHHFESGHEARLWATYAPSVWLAGQGGNHSMVNGRLEWPRWWFAEQYAEHLPLVVCPPRQDPVPGCHYGYDAADGTWDPWIANKVHDHDKLRQRLVELKHEALRHGLLPAVSHPYCTMERVASLCTDQCDLRPVAFAAETVLTLTQQPYGQLFPNPWYSSPRESVRQAPRPEGEATGRRDEPRGSSQLNGEIRPPEAAAAGADEPSPGTTIGTGARCGGESPGGPCGDPGASAAA